MVSSLIVTTIIGKSKKDISCFTINKTFWKILLIQSHSVKFSGGRIFPPVNLPQENIIFSSVPATTTFSSAKTSYSLFCVWCTNKESLSFDWQNWIIWNIPFAWLLQFSFQGCHVARYHRWWLCCFGWVTGMEGNCTSDNDQARNFTRHVGVATKWPVSLFWNLKRVFPFQTALGFAAQLFQAHTGTPATQVTPTT